MINPTTISMIRDIVAIFGVIAGFSYYVMTVRINQRNQKRAEETRKIQLIYEQNRSLRESGSTQRWYQVMNMEWENYDDFMTKYNWENNPELADSWRSLCHALNFFGLLIRDGIVDTAAYVQISFDNAPIFWDKFRSIIEEMRIRNDSPDIFSGIEVLARETDKYRISRGLKPKGISDR